MGRNQGDSLSSSTDEPEVEEEPSTSSDEDINIGSKPSSKRSRKYYRPEEEEIFELDGSDSESISLDESGESVRDQGNPPKHRKRKKQSDEESLPESATSYDEEEAALQHALALSLVNTPADEEGASLLTKRATSSRPSLDEARRKYDPEEAAFQQALAASMTDAEGILDSVKITERDQPSSSNCKDKQFGHSPLASASAPQNASLHSSPSRPIPIDGHDAVGLSPAKSKARKKTGKPVFPAPSMQMVQQAFDMLDPTGSGAINPYALREVATKLLHKDLDDEQLLAMMEFAESMTSKNQGGIPGVVDAEGFCRLVARFSSQED